jgi:hypothetical protein
MFHISPECYGLKLTVSTVPDPTTMTGKGLVRVWSGGLLHGRFVRPIVPPSFNLVAYC